MSKSIPFEKSIQELEAIVALLEKGDLSLDDSLKQFEKGIGLAKICQEKLTNAEQKIETLSSSAKQKSEGFDE